MRKQLVSSELELSHSVLPGGNHHALEVLYMYFPGHRTEHYKDCIQGSRVNKMNNFYCFIKEILKRALNIFFSCKCVVVKNTSITLTCHALICARPPVLPLLLLHYYHQGKYQHSEKRQIAS